MARGSLFIPFSIVAASLGAMPASAGNGAEPVEAAPGPLALAITFAPGSDRYTLSGAGFNALLPSALSTTLGATVRFRRPGAPWEIELAYRSQSTRYTGLSPLVPGDVSLGRQRLGVLAGFRPFRETSRWLDATVFHVGYGFRWNRVELTTPNAVLLPFDESGIQLDVTWGLELKHGFGLEARAEVFFPNSFREKLGTTGAHERGFAAEGTLGLRYRAFDAFSLGLAVRYGYEGHVYSGSGTRGVSGADESYSSWSLPFEVRYGY